MNILVTVGTTKFDSLIKYLDQNLIKNVEFVFQIANGKYLPKNFTYFRFTNEIEKYYEEADIVITHAGAGTIYRLLEKRKKMIIVPNNERRDNHQVDIAKFMDLNGYAKSITEFNSIEKVISEVIQNEFNVYKKHNFDKAKEIVDIVLNKFTN